jgi:acetyl esterase/lipase
MPLAPLIKSRIQNLLDESLTPTERWQAWDSPINMYVSPPVGHMDFVIAGREAEFKARFYRPANNDQTLPVLVWFHGGGFVEGFHLMNESEIVSRELSHRAGYAVLNVDYRLVNQTVKFPAPYVDGTDAVRWLASNAEKLNINPAKIFVGGISAGGTLAAAIATDDRNTGAGLIAGMLLNCPNLHRVLPPFSEELQSKLDEEPATFFFKPDGIKAHNEFMFAGDPSKAPDWYFAGDAADLTGICPTQIINCEYDSLRSSGEKYGQDLAAAGVEVELLTQASVHHAHINRIPADLPEMGETMDTMAAWMKAHA